MDTPPVVPPSFIPKKPLVSGARLGGGSAALGMFIFFVSLMIFIASIVAAGAAFAYQGYLRSSLAQKSDTLQKDEAAFDPTTIKDLIRLDARMNNAEALLQAHVTAYPVFDLLSQQTLQKVQFTKFNYSIGTDGTAAIALTGIADSFTTVALQSDQFNASTMLKNVVFSGITINPDKTVTFDIKATLNPDLISYTKSLQGAAAASTAAAPSTSTQNTTASSSSSTTQ